MLFVCIAIGSQVDKRNDECGIDIGGVEIRH